MTKSGYDQKPPIIGKWFIFLKWMEKYSTFSIKHDYLPQSSVWLCRRYRKNRRQSPNINKFYNLTEDRRYAGVEKN